MASLWLEYPELNGNDVEILVELGIESRVALEQRAGEITHEDLTLAVEKVKLPTDFKPTRLEGVLGLL